MAGTLLRAVSLGLVLAVVWQTPGYTQEKTSRYVNTVEESAVHSRTRPEYDPVGARVGSFFLYPFLRVGVMYDDNIFALNVNERSDTILTTSVDLLVQSDWGRHLLDFEFGASNQKYSNFSSENHTDLYARSKMRIDVYRNFNIGGYVSIARLHEARGSSDSPTAANEPTPYNKLDASISFNKRFNRFTAQLGGGIQHFDYEDVGAIGGGIIDQDIRDGNIYTVLFRKAYEFSPGYRAFGLIEGNWRDFGGNTAATNRDSQGVEARAGIEFEITQLMAGELSGGYMYQDYNSPIFSDVGDFAVRGALLWNPTMLMTVNLNAQRLISETTFGGASGHVDTIVSAQVDYEIKRNLIGSPYISYTIEDYQGIAREDKTLKTGVSLKYLINRNFSAKAYYRFTTKDSNINTFDYKRSQVGGTVKLQF